MIKLSSRGQRAVSRAKGFVNLNRFKSGKAIKRLNKVTYDKRREKVGKGLKGTI